VVSGNTVAAAAYRSLPNGVYETVKRPSVGQSTPRCGGFAAVGPASRKYRSFAATASSVALSVDVGS